MNRLPLALTLLTLLSTSLSLSAVGHEKPNEVAEELVVGNPDQEHTAQVVDTLPAKIEIKTIYGNTTVTEPVLIELLHHPAMARLKDVDQFGPAAYYRNIPTFDRYTHSVGVFFLLRRFGATLIEQVAGLLHDASHTTCSHLADKFYKTGNKVAYQDRVHCWHLRKMGVDTVLEKHGLSIEAIIPEDHKIVKTPPPTLCSDYLEYNLRTGLMFGRLTQEEVTEIIDNVQVDNGVWFFTDATSARKFADQPLYDVEHFFGAAWNVMLYHWMSSALGALVAQELISSEDIHFGRDQKIISLLEQSKDLHIQEMIKKCRNPHAYYQVTTDASDYDVIEHPKCRAINPLVEKEDGSRVVLSEIDAAFKKQYEHVKQFCSNGIKIKEVLNPEPAPSQLDTLLAKLTTPVVINECVA